MSSAPPIVPRDPADQDVCLVLEDFGRLGLAWRETDPSDATYEEVLKDILDGQYAAPVRVVMFNTAEGWARDVSEDIAKEIARLRYDDMVQGDMSERLREFVGKYL
jgi:hypothetical protein